VDSTLWYGPADRFELTQRTPDGEISLIVRLDRPSTPVTESIRTEYLSFIHDPAGQTVSEAFLEEVYKDAVFAPTFPHHAAILADADGNIWVQDYGYRPVSDQVERFWSVFTSAGQYLGVVTFPARFDVHEIGSDYVLGRWRDEFDVEFEAVYDILKP
jgi:hypothetical protein